MRQRTIAKKIESVGIGLHKGEPIKIILEPLPENSGIVFYRSDEAVTIEAIPQNVINTQMATVVGKGSVYVSTIEHLLSAVYSYGIDNIRITLDANEVPIMDGSGVSFCIMLDDAGVVEQDAPKKLMKIKKPVEIRQGDKFVRVEPAHTNSSYDFTINFPHPSIGEQNYVFHFSKKSYVEDIARARTFGFLKDVQMLRANNLALGGSLENAIVLDDKKILNSEGLRFDNEFVRHKILDAIGDLSLLGMPIICEYSSFAGSHNLNHLLTLEILKSTENYEIIETSTQKDEALQKAFA